MRKWAVLGLLLLIIAEGYIGFTDLFPNDPKGTVVLTVPELVGGMAPIRSGDFRYIIAYELNEIVEPGTVLRQNPSVGTRIKVHPGEDAPEINLTVARGRMEYRVPDCIGEDFRTVREKLTLSGYRVKVTETDGDADIVVDMQPRPDEIIAEGGEITLYYGIGSEVTTVRIPDFKGMELSDAITEMLAAGLYPGDIRRDPSEIPEGQVISQTPPAGAYMPYRTRVTLAVSTGEAETEDSQADFYE